MSLFVGMCRNIIWDEFTYSTYSSSNMGTLIINFSNRLLQNNHTNCCASVQYKLFLMFDWLRMQHSYHIYRVPVNSTQWTSFTHFNKKKKKYFDFFPFLLLSPNTQDKSLVQNQGQFPSHEHFQMCLMKCLIKPGCESISDILAVSGSRPELWLH